MPLLTGAPPPAEASHPQEPPMMTQLPSMVPLFPSPYPTVINMYNHVVSFAEVDGLTSERDDRADVCRGFTAVPCTAAIVNMRQSMECTALRNMIVSGYLSETA